VTPLPGFALEIGTPCTEHRHFDYLYLRCGSGGRVSIAVYLEYAAITGKWEKWRFSELAEPEEPPEQFQYPAVSLAVTTWARERGMVTERVVYADGPYLWLKIVVEVGEQFKWARLVVADRRHLTDGDRSMLPDALGLGDRFDLNDDAALGRVLRARPSLPPGKYGSVRAPDRPGP
jgi:hypothetical protein